MNHQDDCGLRAENVVGVLLAAAVGVVAYQQKDTLIPFVHKALTRLSQQFQPMPPMPDNNDDDDDIMTPDPENIFESITDPIAVQHARRVMTCLSSDPIHYLDIAYATGIDREDVLCALASLVSEHIAIESGLGTYKKRFPTTQEAL